MERGGTDFLQTWNFGFIRQNSRLAGFENTKCGCKNFWYKFLIKNHNIDSYMSGTPNHSQGGQSSNQIHFGKVSVWRQVQCENLLFYRNWELTKYESNKRLFFLLISYFRMKPKRVKFQNDQQGGVDSFRHLRHEIILVRGRCRWNKRLGGHSLETI